MEEEDDSLLRQCQTKSTTIDQIQILSSFNDIGWSPDTFSEDLRSNKWQLREFHLLTGIFCVEWEDECLPTTVWTPEDPNNDPIETEPSLIPFRWSIDAFSERTKSNKWKFGPRNNHYWSICVERNFRKSLTQFMTEHNEKWPNRSRISHSILSDSLDTFSEDLKT